MIVLDVMSWVLERVYVVELLLATAVSGRLILSHSSCSCTSSMQPGPCAHA